MNNDRTRYLVEGDYRSYYLDKLRELEELEPLRNKLTEAKYQRDEGFSSEAASIGKQIEATEESLKSGTTAASFKRMVGLYSDAVNREDLTKMITTMNKIESAVKIQPGFIDGLNDLERRMVDRADALADVVSQRTLAFALNLQSATSDPYGLSFQKSKIMLANLFPMKIVDGDEFQFGSIVEPLQIYSNAAGTVPNINLLFLTHGNNTTLTKYQEYFSKGSGVRIEYVALVQYALSRNPSYTGHQNFRNALKNSAQRFQKEVTLFIDKLAKTAL
jgi:hypothetical protein